METAGVDFDELHTEVPEGSCAVIRFAPSPHVDAKISALITSR